VSDRRFMALAGAPDRFLGAPADRLAEAADRGRMVGDTELEANHHGDPSPGPHVSPQPVAGRAALEECGSPGALLPREAACRSGRRAMLEGRQPSVAGPGHPLTDGPFADAQRFGKPALRPALRREVPGVEPSGFFPVGR
jgi:hypothetical protein